MICTIAGRDRQGAAAVRALRAARLRGPGPGEQAEQAADVRQVQEAPRGPLARLRSSQVRTGIQTYDRQCDFLEHAEIKAVH